MSKWIIIIIIFHHLLGHLKSVLLKTIYYMRILKYIMLISIILLTSFINIPIHDNDFSGKYNEIVKMDNYMIWVGDWIESDNLSSDYGRGRFFYRFSRSKYPVDRYNNYKHEISFISDSFYPHYMYTDKNGDGNLDTYRCATKIDNMTLYVNGIEYINILTGTSNFWLLFNGDFENGIGEVRVQFLYPTNNPSIFIQWTDPKPF